MKRARDATVTIKDIARKLGMSHPTVSRAINGNRHTSEATKAIVRKAAAEMGYIPHAGARAMRDGHGRLVGLVVPVIQTEFYHTVVKVLAEHAARADYQLVLALSEDDPKRELEQIRTLVEARAAGIIVAPTATPLPRTLKLLAATTSLQLNRFVPQLGCDGLTFDDAAGTGAATKHLIELGHRRIAFVGATEEMSTGSGRLRGFKDALRDAGIELDPSLVRLGPPRTPFGLESMIALIDSSEPPSATMLTSSELTAGGLEAIRLRKVFVPRDMSLIGYTDPIWYKFIVPTLTTISLPVKALAETTASLLFGRIEHAQENTPLRETTPKHVTLAPELIVRNSTAAPHTNASSRAKTPSTRRLSGNMV